MSDIKIQSILVDTLTAIQDNQYASDKKKPGHDQWFDYGTTVFNFITELQNMGFEIVLVIGPPGQGKSSSVGKLAPNTNIWYNADNKNPTWLGGRQEYGKKHKPRAPYHVIPKTYNDILKHISGGMKKGMFAEDKVAFITGHSETYKEGFDQKVRLKTLGKLANKMQIEGKLETVLYTRVQKNEISGETEYLFETQNSGANTARSHQGMLDGIIPNDLNLVREAILNY